MNNLTIDVLIGLVLIYLVFSIFVSALTEYFVNGVFSARSKNLRNALRSAFGAKSRKEDPSADRLVQSFLNQGIILSLYNQTKDSKSAPSAIPEPVFAKGFIATLQQVAGITALPATPAQFLSLCGAAAAKQPGSIKPSLLETVRSLHRGHETDWTGFEKEIAIWFAEVGERSSGWYKRNVEIWKLIIALLLVVAINVDTVFVYRMLSIDSRSRQSLVALSEDTLRTGSAPTLTAEQARALPPATEAVSLKQAREEVDQQLARAFGIFHNGVVDDKEFRDFVNSRCRAKNGGESLKGSDGNPGFCGADGFNWYDTLVGLRKGFAQAFTHLECDDTHQTCQDKRKLQQDKPNATCNIAEKENELTPPPTLSTCINELIAVKNSFGQILGEIPADNARHKKNLPSNKAISEALASAIKSARSQLPAIARSVDPYCEQMDDPKLRSSEVTAREKAERKTALDDAKQKCTKQFARARRGELGMPLGWDPDLQDVRFHLYAPTQGVDSFFTFAWLLSVLLGWTLSCIALSLGSQFWFNALGRLMAIRLSGNQRSAEAEAERAAQAARPPASSAGEAQPGGVNSPAGGGATYFSDALNSAEARLSQADIIRIQSGIGMSPPLSGRLDKATREAIHQWHGGGDDAPWQLEERHINQLLNKQIAPLPESARVRIVDAPARTLELKRGDAGEDVIRYKNALAATLKNPLQAGLTLDSPDFDEPTEAATREFQTGKNLTCDGIAGPATLLRLTSDLELLPARFGQPSWMAHAIHEIGQAEIPGRRNNSPRIEEYRKAPGANAAGDAHWCSSFAIWVLSQAGIATDGATPVASSWCTWGEDDPAQQYGSIIVIAEKVKSIKPGQTGAHVGFLVQVVSGRYFLLGGNQKDSVCVSAYPETSWEVLAVRKPKALPADNTATEDTTEQAGPAFIPATRFGSHPVLRRGCTDRSAVMRLQELLNRPNGTLDVDGIFGADTEMAVVQFQKDHFGGKVPANGVVDGATWNALEVAQPSQGNSSDASNREDTPERRTTGFLEDFATKHGLTLAHLLAVREVESNGSGFLSKGKPRILFEGHQFYRLLKEAGISKGVLGQQDTALVYPSYDRSRYAGGLAEWSRLEKARQIAVGLLAGEPVPKGCLNHADIADQAASWGMFQIMGFNYADCDCDNVAEYVKRSETEDGQIELFLEFLVKYRRKGQSAEGPLMALLRAQDWAGFAAVYNGPAYRTNKYDLKLKSEFDRYA